MYIPIYTKPFIKKGRKRNVYISVSCNSLRSILSTGISIDPKLWDKNNMSMAAIKPKLLQIEKDLEEAAIKVKESGRPLTPEEIIRQYKAGPDYSAQSEETFSKAAEYRLNKLNEDSAKTINNAKLKFLEFAGKDLPIHQITRKTMIDFKQFLESGDHYVYYSTRKSYLSRIIGVLKQYVAYKDLPVIINYDLKSLDVSLTERDKQTKMGKPSKMLSDEELTSIISADLNESNDYYRNIFMLQVHSGLAYNEIRVFDIQKHVITDMKGMKWIVMKRKKTISTEDLSYIPLEKSFIKYYDLVKEKGLNVNYYTYGKKIGKISKDLVGRKITTHMGRHTFGRIKLEEGWSMEAVSKMLGHSTIAMTEGIYAKVTIKKLYLERERIISSSK